jgi:hypothetical protein
MAVNFIEAQPVILAGCACDTVRYFPSVSWADPTLTTHPAATLGSSELR